jgi:hypothetical protein
MAGECCSDGAVVACLPLAGNGAAVELQQLSGQQRQRCREARNRRWACGGAGKIIL